ncbi:hypothetical protein KM043_014929 [Ampulex compressa]|nr:hypothetical protein KM043_014929 [Ampulex compressa]
MPHWRKLLAAFNLPCAFHGNLRTVSQNGMSTKRRGVYGAELWPRVVQDPTSQDADQAGYCERQRPAAALRPSVKARFTGVVNRTGLSEGPFRMMRSHFARISTFFSMEN